MTEIKFEKQAKLKYKKKKKEEMKKHTTHESESR